MSTLKDGICTVNHLHSELPLDADGQFTIQELTQAKNQWQCSHWVGKVGDKDSYSRILVSTKGLLNVAYASCSPAGNRRFRHFSLQLVSHNGCCHIYPLLVKKNDMNILEVCSICLCIISSLNLCRSLKWM